MESLEYVSLAKSTDKTRYMLNSVYRDATALVATDGYRLHWIDGLPEQKPAYIDGLDAQFPDYAQVLPKGTPSATVGLLLDRSEKRLTGLLKLAQCVNAREPIVQLTAKQGKLSAVQVD